MPQGTDLVVWNPRRGPSGDDRYLLPEGERIAAGSGTFSTPPTLDEVNASSGFNQLPAEIGRRYGLPPSSLRSSGAKVLASDFVSMRSVIDGLRTHELLPAYAWGDTPVIGGRIKGLHLADLRKALATDHYIASSFTSGANGYVQIQKAGDPPVFFLFSGSPYGPYFGHTTSFNSWRGFRSYVVPPGVTPVSGSIGIRVLQTYGSGFNVVIYLVRSNLQPLDNGDWDRRDELIYSGPPVVGNTEVPVTLGGLSPGSIFTLMITTDRELSQYESPIQGACKGYTTYVRLYP